MQILSQGCIYEAGSKLKAFEYYTEKVIALPTFFLCSEVPLLYCRIRKDSALEQPSHLLKLNMGKASYGRPQKISHTGYDLASLLKQVCSCLQFC